MKTQIINQWKDFGNEIRFELFSVSWVCNCELYIVILNFGIEIYFPELAKRSIEKIKDAECRFFLRNFDEETD